MSDQNQEFKSVAKLAKQLESSLFLHSPMDMKSKRSSVGQKNSSNLNLPKDLKKRQAESKANLASLFAGNNRKGGKKKQSKVTKTDRSRNVEVLEPLLLRNWVKTEISQMAQAYK